MNFELAKRENDSAISFCEYFRQKGNTTALIKLLKNDGRALLIVSNNSFAERLAKENYLSRDRILTLNEFRKVQGLTDSYPLFDNSVVCSLALTNNNVIRKMIEVKKLFEEAGKLFRFYV